MSTLHHKIIGWFAKGETGLSSEHMACVAAGHEGNGNHPRDPSDLRRCAKLVEMVPEVMEHFDRIAASTAQWETVIAHWHELVALVKEEANGQRFFSAPKTYERMKALGL